MTLQMASNGLNCVVSEQITIGCDATNGHCYDKEEIDQAEAVLAVRLNGISDANIRMINGSFKKKKKMKEEEHIDLKRLSLDSKLQSVYFENGLKEQQFGETRLDLEVTQLSN